MKQLIIITPSLYDFKNNVLKIGGLETYIKDLAMLGIENTFEIIVYQIEKNIEASLTIEYKGFKVSQLTGKTSLFKSSNQYAFDKIFKKHNNDGTKFVIATDQMDIKSNASNVITIQHGIAFDIPGYMIKGFWGKTHCLQFVNKMLRCIKNVRRFYNTRNTVCVDYNYYNWFRTLGTIYEGYNIKVIPNYASSYISEDDLKIKLSRNNEVKRIVFARRFVEYRGAMLFAAVVKRLLNQRMPVDITFAGNGPLEEKLKEMFKDDKSVHFTRFTADKSIEFHKQFDIAVVPTIFSEGTSLSLCEAMAAGCIPIATHVGGMTNMILDGFNGFLSYPSVQDVYDCVVKVMEMSIQKQRELKFNANRSVKNSFSIEFWKKQWIVLLEK